jgi:hypothetical protein
VSPGSGDAVVVHHCVCVVSMLRRGVKRHVPPKSLYRTGCLRAVGTSTSAYHAHISVDPKWVEGRERDIPFPTSSSGPNATRFPTFTTPPTAVS